MKIQYLTGALCVGIFSLGSATSQAALVLDITSITNNQLSFSLTGTPDSGGLPLNGSGAGAFNDHQLRLFSTNQSNWIISSSGTYTDQALISGNPMNTLSQISLMQVWDDEPFVLGGGGMINIVYDSDLLTTDTGTSISTTITLPGEWSFMPENLSSLSLSWGYLTVDDPVTTGALQSSYSISSVPIPAAFYLFGSGLLGLVGMARRKA